MLKDGVPTFHARSASEWRAWLQSNHASEKSVWLIIYRKESSVPSVYYPEAVDQALCFGWIFNAKRPDTRAKRILETARLANDNIRANQYRK